jgi:hypothetical protein
MCKNTFSSLLESSRNKQLQYHPEYHLLLNETKTFLEKYLMFSEKNFFLNHYGPCNVVECFCVNLLLLLR